MGRPGGEARRAERYDGPMQFGLSLLGLAQQPVGEDMRERLAEILRWVHEARETDFDYLMLGQHYLSSPFQAFQPVPLLARLVPESGDMRLVSTLVGPLHNPVDLAETWATLDVLSGGRVGLSIGLGYRDVEYRAFGVDRATRVRRMRDTVETLRDLWTGEPVTRSGDGFLLDRAVCTLAPLQRPHPPIWIAASADAAIQRAAGWGLDWNINAQATVPEVARQAAVYAAAARSPEPPRFAMSRELFCAATTEEAIRVAGPYLANKYEVRKAWRSGAEAPAQPGTVEAESPFILGDPDECARQIERYREVGVDRMHLRMNWPGMPLEASLRGLRLFATEVLPRFRA